MTNATRPRSIACARCGTEKPVGARGPIPIYCSSSCRATVKHERSKGDGRYEKTLAAARMRTAQRQVESARPCPHCGALMLNPRRIQCGDEPCRLRAVAARMRAWQRDYQAEHGLWYRGKYPTSQRAASLRRRQRVGHWRELYPEKAATYDARRRALVSEARVGEVFAPDEIHARDGWTCLLCREPIDQGIAWPHPKSPSIDHVIPLSRGGVHTRSNVQSAHLGCNSSKGDRLLAKVIDVMGMQVAGR